MIDTKLNTSPFLASFRVPPCESEEGRGQEPNPLVSMICVCCEMANLGVVYPALRHYYSV